MNTGKMRYIAQQLIFLALIDELLKLNNRFKYFTVSLNTALFEFDFKNFPLIFNDEWWKITGYSEDNHNLDFWEREELSFCPLFQDDLYNAQ